jgi:hypothetical protein
LLAELRTIPDNLRAHVPEGVRERLRGGIEAGLKADTPSN